MERIIVIMADIQVPFKLPTLSRVGRPQVVDRIGAIAAFESQAENPLGAYPSHVRRLDRDATPEEIQASVKAGMLPAETAPEAVDDAPGASPAPSDERPFSAILKADLQEAALSLGLSSEGTRASLYARVAAEAARLNVNTDGEWSAVILAIKERQG